MNRFLLIFFLFFCFISTNVNGYQYYYFDAKKIKTSKESFYRYIRPQIRNIVLEYYHILKKVSPVPNNPILGNLININKQILALNVDWNKWIKKCEKVTPECYTLLKKFYSNSRKLDYNILSQQGQKLEMNVKDSKIDNLLNLSHSLDRLSNLNYRNLHRVEEMLIVANTSYYWRGANKRRFNHQLYEMQLIAETILTCILDDEYINEFEFLWSNFIKYMEIYVIIGRNQNYLVNNLASFNLAWNSFHMKMTKGNVSTPVGFVTTIKLMHNRWNSILKMYLKNTIFLERNGRQKSPD